MQMLVETIKLLYWIWYASSSPIIYHNGSSCIQMTTQWLNFLKSNEN